MAEFKILYNGYVVGRESFDTVEEAIAWKAGFVKNVHEITMPDGTTLEECDKNHVLAVSTFQEEKKVSQEP